MAVKYHGIDEDVAELFHDDECIRNNLVTLELLGIGVLIGTVGTLYYPLESFAPGGLNQPSTRLRVNICPEVSSRNQRQLACDHPAGFLRDNHRRG